MNAGALLREARLAAGITQAELADRLRTTQSAVARLEAPGANPRMQTVDRAIAATGQRLVLSLEPSFGIDPTLIAGSLRQTPAERMRAFESFYEFGAQASAASRHGP